MRISLLTQREPFYEILLETVTDYMHAYESNIELSYEHRSDAVVTYYSIEKLNVFVPSGVDKSYLLPLRKEYGQSVSWRRKILQTIYFNVVTSAIGMRLFASKVLSSSSDLSEYLPIILGGNNRLRTFHPREYTSTVILKAGFDSKYVANDIELRSSLNLEYAPRLLDFDVNKKWLKESYHPGIPINRLDFRLMHKLVQDICSEHIRNCVLPTLKTTSLDTYVTRKVSCITEYLSSLNNLDRSLIIALNNLICQIDMYSKRIGNISINVSWTHGDFQKANVLYTQDNNIKVIDWEAADIRVAIYDIVTMFADTRTSLDVDRIVKIFSNPATEAQVRLVDEKYHQQGYMIAYLIDELMYRINSSCNNRYFNSGRELDKNILVFQKLLSTLA